MPSDTCPTCGSTGQPYQRDVMGVHGWGVISAGSTHEACADAWHLEAAATPPTSDAVREALRSARWKMRYDLSTADYVVPEKQWRIITAALADHADAARVARLEAAITWAIGAGADFPTRGENDGAYWWRAELAKRAGAEWNREGLAYDFLAPQPTHEEAGAL